MKWKHSHGFPDDASAVASRSTRPNEGLIVQGDKDQVVNIESVNKLVDKLKDQRGQNGVDYRVIEGAGHFFNNAGETEQLVQHVNNYLGRTLAAEKAAA